jgi:hypothetical protein
MKRLFRLIVVAVAVSSLAGIAAAQTTTGILNTLEVQRLVGVDTLAAHVLLSRHYMALADKLAADAARFDALARVPTGDPNHQAPPGADTRRMHQAENAMAFSEAAREMAAYHQFLSLGMTPAPPPDLALFEGGFGARVPTAAEVDGFVAAARTAADHRALEEYFRIVAEHSDADAKAHAAKANSYRVGSQRRGSEFAAMHCDRLAQEAREAGRQASAAAALHHQLANVG